MELKSELELLNQQAQEEKKRGEMLIQSIRKVSTLKAALLKQQTLNNDAESESKRLVQELVGLKVRNLTKKNNTEHLKDLVFKQELEVRELKRELEEMQGEFFNGLSEYVNQNIPRGEVDQGGDLDELLKENKDVMKEVAALKGKVEGLSLIAELGKKKYNRIVMFVNELEIKI